ncbi:MAG: namA [Acidobacteria bacterium]|nr:namA [Acidobacteriota bacterium]
MSDLFDTVRFPRGPVMPNRFVLGPLTNNQSLEDGRLGEDEFRWLTRRAAGGFGLVMTCAAHVQAQGRGWPGQLGIFSDEHLEGLSRLAAGVTAHGSLAMVQLHHAGIRAQASVLGSAPVGPSDHAKTGARALGPDEVEQVAADFVAAARRAERAGYDGVELHAAHGYLICQFLSAELNRRTDGYGGPLENRERLLFDIVAGIRAQCSPGFLLAVRLSPERFGMNPGEVREVARRLLAEGAIDLLDMSLWDVHKEPELEEYRGRPLHAYFTDLERSGVLLAVGGKVMGGTAAARALATGADLVVVGRAAILHHDFPKRVAADPGFEAVALPVSRDYLRGETVGETFLKYLENWKGFLEPEPE